jgi:hypothetical protein
LGLVILDKVHISGWRRHENWRIRGRRWWQRWETWPVEKSSGKDAGKDTRGSAAVEHTNFAARDYDMQFYFFSEKILGDEDEN